jgi:hypothetical protein
MEEWRKVEFMAREQGSLLCFKQNLTTFHLKLSTSVLLLAVGEL